MCHCHQTAMVTVMVLERIKSPICPVCGKPMRFARSIPGNGGLPELRTYDCKMCETAETEVMGPRQPREFGRRSAAAQRRKAT
jgi:hypothetical protein